MNCPSCGSPVTLDLGGDWPLSTTVPEAVLGVDEGASIEITRTCWDCGWQESRLVRIETIDTTAGDDHAAKRAALVDEITNEVGAIEDLTTLRDALAEVRRQRRLETTSTDPDDETDTTETGDE
jgi:hypothetical protein